MRNAVSPCALLIAAACAAPAIAQHSADGANGNVPCYGSTKDWQAWIQPGPGEPELVVKGVVTTPTGGSWNVLTLGPTPWDEPPRQIVKLEIRAMGEIVTAAVTTEEVQARFRVPPHFGRSRDSGTVIIQCNGKEVGRARAARRTNADR